MQAWQATVQDDNGNVVVNPSITVYQADGVTLAQIYNQNETPKANPFIGTLEGFVQFFAPDGDYRIRGSKGANQTEFWSVTLDATAAAAIAARNQAQGFATAASTSAGNAATSATTASTQAGIATDAAAQAVEAADSIYTYAGALDAIRSRMAAGAIIRVACFGDSTTDGNGTSGWVANPVNGSGAAIGSAAHNPEFAWPAQAQTILRRMYKNNSISFWNAGYSGRSIIQGWAVNNYDAAVINNPAYGVPDVTTIGFGLNDATVPGFTPALFETRVRELIEKIISYPTIPVILTPDPVMENTNRQGGYVSRVTAILRRVAGEYGIEVFETGAALETVFSNSGTNNLWAFHQADDLHFGNVGHRVKAAFISAKLFTNTLWLDDQDTANIAPWSKYTNSQNLQYGTFDGVNNRFGACINVAANSYATGEALLDMWVWTNRPDLNVFWRSVSSDNYYNPAPLNTAPALECHSYIFPSGTSVKSSTAGATQQPIANREAETPTRISGLSTGLSRVSYIAPTDTANRPLSLGYFSIRPTRNDLTTTINGYWGAGSGQVVFDIEPAENRSLLVGAGFSRSFLMHFKLATPVGSGVFIYANRSFDDGSGGANRKTRGLVIQRRATQVALLDVTYDGSGVIAVSQLGVADYTWSDADNEFTLRGAAGNGTQHTLQLAQATVPLLPLMTLTAERTAQPWTLGGRVGPIYKDFGISTAAGRVRFEIYGV